MPIKFDCPLCGASLTIPDQYAGMQGRCKGCGQIVTAPNLQAPPTSAPAPPIVEPLSAPVSPEPVIVQEPIVPEPAVTPEPAIGSAPQVTFKGSETNQGNQYEVYTALSRDDALAFLRLQEVKEERRYVVVETPSGNLGKDLVMIFDEATGDRIEFGERKPLPEMITSMTKCAQCGYTVLPAGAPASDAYADPMTVEELITVQEMKEQGTGYYCPICQTLWCPFCTTLQGTNAVCGICGGDLKLFRE